MQMHDFVNSKKKKKKEIKHTSNKCISYTFRYMYIFRNSKIPFKKNIYHHGNETFCCHHV